ncbi:MAG: FHA domain-containing protein [Calditrichaeota bacterium]|nr:MAG: FHA domain-containing protein [Calditrichota bacterium]
MSKKAPTSQENPSGPPRVHAAILEDGQKTRELTFRKTFTVGRDDSCEIQLFAMGVSRKHAKVYYHKGRWWIEDLNSSNGTYINGEKIEKMPLGTATKVQFGSGDAILEFSVEGFSSDSKTVKEKPPSVTQYIKRYFDEGEDQSAGEHTQMIRGAYKVVQKKQRRKYYLIIGGVVFVALLIGLYSIYQHQQFKKQRLLAEQIFYSMKSLELELSELRNEAQSKGDNEALAKLTKTQTRRAELLRSYDKLLDQLHFYEDTKWSEKDRIILRVARAFGECELGMPDEFLNEVYGYIERWKTTSRLENALLRAISNDYPELISEIMLEYDLSPLFFYLALQESDFIVQTIGPRTRFGIAKGIWQFIPATAARYGLNTGPLVGIRRYDPRDERFDVLRASRAAARYIRDIYESEAQASGLLVVASYNWGERKVRELIRQMPHNPQERNFWELLKLYKAEIPAETYNYVFYIISAAVIGENPQLFGFGFNNPLEFSADGS